MEKLFTIQPDFHYGIYTGLSEENLQVFASDGGGSVLVVVYFSSSGKMLRYVELSSLEINYEMTNSPLKNDELEEIAISTALKEIGLIKIQPIRVEKFFIVKHMMGVRQFPDSLQRFLEGGTEYTPEEIEELKEIPGAFSEADLTGYTLEEDIQDRQMFKDWQERGDFVLHCGNDFWCFSDGEIHSS